MIVDTAALNCRQNLSYLPFLQFLSLISPHPVDAHGALTSWHMIKHLENACKFSHAVYVFSIRIKSFTPLEAADLPAHLQIHLIHTIMSLQHIVKIWTTGKGCIGRPGFMGKSGQQILLQFCLRRYTSGRWTPSCTATKQVRQQEIPYKPVIADGT